MEYQRYATLVFLRQGGCGVFRLKELRKKKCLSQVTLALELNMNPNSISRYETGEWEAEYKTLIAFANYFCVSVDHIIASSGSFC